MEKKKLKVCWISAGVSSFIAGWLSRDTIDEYIYIDIENQHPDSMRFIKDCEKELGKPVKILMSPYRNVENAIKKGGFINRPKVGAYCTKLLKKMVRKEWECEHKDIELTYVWGFDIDERHRAKRLIEAMTDFKHEFPLIDKQLSKQDAHGILEQIGIKRPVMYDMGYNNNNCVGCVKGGMGYWNKIRKDFPEVFDRMAKLEREVGSSCINGVYLDELDQDKGRMSEEIMQDCNIFCMLGLQE